VVRDPTVSPPRLSDLRAAGPADSTLRNLLQTLSSKLELYERLAVLEYEASADRHASAAAAFRELAVIERRSCEDLVQHLRRHLDETAGAVARTSARPERDAPS
jgi:hypothetical protein